MTELKSRQIGCCGAYTWAKWIAYIDTAFCAAVFLMSLLATQVEEREDDEFFQNENKVRNAYIRMVASLIGLALPILLHLGIKKERPDFLRVWLIIKKIFAGIALLLIACIFLLSADIGLIVAFLCAIPLGVSIFSIWVVDVYRDELIAHQTQGNPDIGFQSL